MHSDDETSTQNDNPSDLGSRPLPIRREVPVTDRQRDSFIAGAMGLAGALSLAGFALGFGLGHVTSVNSSNCAHHVVVHAQAPSPERVQIRPHREARLTWLGVIVKSGAGMQTGATVETVHPGSPAAEAGLEEGHRIVGIDSEPVHSASGLRHQIQFREAREKIVVHVRDSLGSALTLPVVLDSISPSEFRQLAPRSRR